MPRAWSSSATIEATRPPIDLPPMISGWLQAAASTASMYSALRLSALGGGLRKPDRRAAM